MNEVEDEIMKDEEEEGEIKLKKGKRASKKSRIIIDEDDEDFTPDTFDEKSDEFVVDDDFIDEDTEEKGIYIYLLPLKRYS